jgi:hypothetical protein
MGSFPPWTTSGAIDVATGACSDESAAADRKRKREADCWDVALEGAVIAGKLRKVRGAPVEMGMYTASGTLEGVRPGRRTVKELEVRRLDRFSVDGLRPLTAFEDLEILELARLDGVDLEPLAELSVTVDRLGLTHLTGVDLSPLGHLRAVAGLYLMDVADDCRVPEELPLPSSLRRLFLTNDGRGLSGDPVRRLIEAIDWERLGELRALELRVGGLEPLSAIEVDLGFLSCLPKLERLDVRRGVWHAGPRPSPLEPPFKGLSRNLTWLRINAWDPEPTKAQLRDLLGFQPTVYQRYGPQPRAASWTIHAPDDGVDDWQMYGSLADAFADQDFATEYDALKYARKRIRDADVALLRRLDFDPENAGTGIAAVSKEDLVAALRLLELHPDE